MSLQDSANNPMVRPLTPATVPAGQGPLDVPGEKEDKFYYATQWSLIWWRFKKHKLAMIASFGLALLYLIAVFADFVAPYSATQ